ncbi:hypothetical protein STAS_20457 [Striga asiatica]|uniref:Uncharacterized protein n=1 Tax=Striga asiatica TaxID=4170 RepID=A0A5A7QF39_STRAF|nr:hypothetical protein STAS_20457 [Striga asiatica]
MVLFAEKLGCHHKNSKTALASLNDFQSEISSFLKETTVKLAKSPKSLSMQFFQNLFELINFADQAFAKLTTKIDYPMSQWGGKATHEYLNHSLIFLQMLNSISTLISHLNQARVSISRSLSLIEKNSINMATKYLKKSQGTKISNPSKCTFSVEGLSTGVEKKPGCEKKERVVLEALIVVKKIRFFALGLVMSRLCEDKKMCWEVGVFSGDEPFKMVLDLGFRKEVVAVMEIGGPMDEVNRAVERVCEGLLMSNGKVECEAMKELKGRLKVLDNCVEFVEKEVNGLFCQVLGVRSKLLDNIRIIGQDP